MNILLTCAMDARNGGFNWSFYCNEEIDSAIAAAREMADGPEKYAATEAIVTQIMEDSPYIPMLEPQVVVVHPNDLAGVAFEAASMPLGEIVYVPSSLRGEDLGCPDCSLGAMLNLQPMFESLLYRELESGAIIEDEGRLAETWSVNDDFTEYSFTLRKGMQFHNGWGEVTTDDIEFSFGLMTGEETNNPQAHVFGKMDLVIDDKYSFRLVSETPSPTVLAALTEMPLAFMVTSKSYWGSVGEEKARLHPIGTGPTAGSRC